MCDESGMCDFTHIQITKELAVHLVDNQEISKDSGVGSSKRDASTC